MGTTCWFLQFHLALRRLAPQQTPTLLVNRSCSAMKLSPVGETRKQRQCQTVKTDKLSCTNLAVENRIIPLPLKVGVEAHVKAANVSLCLQHAKILNEMQLGLRN